MATLSALLCNYNHGQYVGKAIEALVTQSRPPDELIIIEDGSTDNSVQVIESYARRYPCIKFLRNPANMGLMLSFQRAMSQATGDYIYTPASDDYVLPGFFEKAMRHAQEFPDAGLIFGKINCLDSKGKLLHVTQVKDWPKEQHVTPAQCLAYFGRDPLFVASVSSVYKRSCFVEVGGYRTELGPMSDFFAFQAILLKYGGYYIPQPLAVFNVHHSSYSNTTCRDEAARLQIVQRLATLMRSAEFADHFPPRHVLGFEFYATEFWMRPYDPKIHAVVPMPLGNLLQAFITFSDWDNPIYMIAALFLRFGRALIMAIRSLVAR